MALMDNFNPVDQLTDNLKGTLQSGSGGLKAEVANTLQEAMSAIGLLSQESRFITFESIIDDDFLIASFEADEGINQETCFNLDCLSPSAFIDLSTLLGQRASIGLATADGGRRYWQGYVTKARALGADGSLSRYQLVMESSLAFLSLRRNSLIYQDKTPLEIVDQLLADYPQVQWRDDTQEPLAARAITTQYRETDRDFLQRLLADASLSWRIEQQQDVHPDDEGPGHTLVIFDSQASLALPSGEPSMLRFHRIAATEKEDAISHFNERLQITPNHFTASQWRNEQIKSIAGSAQAAAGDAAPELPGLDHYDSSASHLAFSSDAQRLAQQRLDALRLSHHQYHGKGAVRTLQAGQRYQLSEHASLSGTEFIPLSIHHRATNNLADGLKHTDLNAATLGKGSYRQHFQAVPVGTPIVPPHCPRPQAPACSTATVVGIADQALTTDRDHQIRLQFFWQRGRAPLAGGQTDTHSAQHPDGHATQDETSATWVPVAEALAGAHQGSSFVPRIGSEVLVEFTLGDIDRPLVVGQLYNGTNLPPFHAGDNSNANHPGSLSGIHTQSLDRGLTASWVLDDAPGQLRQGLSHSLANSRLQLGYLIDQQGNHRGQYRGSGIELASNGWLISRAAGGMLVSSSIRHMGQSTQMDTTEAVQQLHAAHQQADSLGAASSQGGGLGLNASDAYTPLLASIDPQADGKYTAPANGQPSTKPTENARSGGEPVEAFNTPVMLFDSPDSISVTSAKSSALFAGEHQHLSSQVDSHIAAHASLASVSGDGSGLYAIDGGVNIKANHGPVSLQAHTDQLHIMADKDAKVSAVSGSIKVMAQKSIQLAAGGATITLEGGNITLSAPGNFSVNTATHSWLPGGSKPASLPSLPAGLASAVPTPTLKVANISSTPSLTKQKYPLAFHVVEKPETQKSLVNRLYNDPTPEIADFIKGLNPALSDELLPGQVFILSHPDGQQNSNELAKMQQDQAVVEDARKQLDPDLQQLAVNHFEFLNDVSSYGSAGAGLFSSSLASTLNGTNKVLRNIEQLYQDTYRQHGKLNVPEFFESRQLLFKQLDTVVGKAVFKGTGFEDAAKVKKQLHLSTKSIVQKWNKTGSAAAGIPGYADNYIRVAKYAKLLKRAGYIGITLDGINSINKITKACSEGREDQCASTKFTEAGRFTGSTAGGMAGAWASYGACNLLFTVVSGGTSLFWCGIVAAGAGGYFSGKYIGKAGEKIGDILYKVNTYDQ